MPKPDRDEERVGGMTMEERKAKAVEALILKSGYQSALSIPRVRRDMLAEDVDIVCRTVFPELFTDPPTAWLAPWEPGKAEIIAGEEELENQTEHDWDSGGDGNSHNSYTYFRSGHIRSVYEAMRDAYLNPNRSEGGTGD
jgi:hypothetical protein